MEKLSIEEYKAREDAWQKKNEEYFSKLIEINKNERDVINEVFHGDADAFLYSNDAKNFDKDRDALKEEYKGFTNEFDAATFYCLLTNEEDIEEAILFDDRTKDWMVKSIKNVGRIMKDGHNSMGKYIGIAVALDDYYYILENVESGEEMWVTCVGEIFPVDEKE